MLLVLITTHEEVSGQNLVRSSVVWVMAFLSLSCCIAFLTLLCGSPVAFSFVDMNSPNVIVQGYWALFACGMVGFAMQYGGYVFKSVAETRKYGHSNEGWQDGSSNFCVSELNP